MILGLPYSARELAEMIESKNVAPENLIIKELTYDTRQITKPQQAVFFALQGKMRNGHVYCLEAYSLGVRCFVVSEEVSLPDDAVVLQVHDTLRAIQKFAGRHRQKVGVRVIGITGSNGKTIVKEWLAQLLQHKHAVVKSPKSYNSQLGVPLSLLQIQPDHDFAVIEVGISEPGEMQFLQQITQPDVGVLTNVGSAHAAHFNNRQQQIQEKYGLFTNTNLQILPGDDAEISQLIADQNSNSEIYTFGKNSGNHVQLLSYDAQMQNAHILYKNKEYIFPFQLADEASLLNLLTVLTTLFAMNFQPQTFVAYTAQLHAVEMRLQIKDGRDQMLIINDAFTADLSSLAIALQVLDSQIQERKTLILTDIEQVNKSESELYAEVSERVNCYPFKVILIGDIISRYADRFLGVAATYTNVAEFLANNQSQQFAQNAVLLKGARRFQLEQIDQQWSSKSHQTILEINLSHIRQNIDYFRTLLASKTKLMGMVKAFGYGTGSLELSKLLGEIGFDYLGVAYADEGADLRREGITTPIVVMNPEQNSYDTLINNRLQPEIYSLRVLQNFQSSLSQKQINEPWPIHIKLNTGMNRLGFNPQDLPALISHLKENRHLRIDSIFSHLAESDNVQDDQFTNHQIEQFEVMSSKICEELAIQPLRHILNTAGILNYRHAQYDMVRLGIGMYGVAEDKQAAKFLQPAVYFKTVISQINTIKSGETVSYGRRFQADRDMQIATLPVGYADGLRRSISTQNAYVSIHKTHCPIIGTICMDMLMVDISHVDCQEGDEVIIFGEDPSLRQMADWAGTIPYEILTSISQRVRRLYVIN